MDTSDTLSQALATFSEEARELIVRMEEILLRAESGDSSEEDMHALFRCAHTIKGSGGLFGLDEVVRFTHVVENVLDRLRNGVIAFSSDLITLLLESQDHIASLVDSSLGEGVETDAVVRSNALIEKLNAWTPQDASKSTAPVTQENAQATPDGTPCSGEMIDSDHWHLSLRFAQRVFTDGMDPLAFIHYLSNVGNVSHLETLTDSLPELDHADPEMCYLGFEVALKSSASKEDIENVFEFVADNATIRIFPPNSKIDEFLALIEAESNNEARLGEILVSCGTLTRKELDFALKEQSNSKADKRLGEILVDSQAVEPVVVDAAISKQRRLDEKRAGEAKSIKVPSDRLDALINRVGELVIAGAGTFAHATKVDRPELQESASLLMSLVEDIREMTLRLRMVAIGEVFSRFPRVVRDVSKELGKPIELRISGAESELDKSMVEKLGDPLMHLIRNSMDHGIESSEERIAAGKPAHGTVSLNAFHESGTIIVEVADDGHGLNPEKILRKAIEKGLVSEGANLTDSEIYRLILEPGFSTAEKVTNLSGRGVGMDVVKSSVEAMRGTLDIQSSLGVGTSIRFCLPLTLAIIDGFHIGVGSSNLIVPLDMVDECVELPPGIENVDYMDQRDEALPFVRLRELFGETGPSQFRPRVVIVRFGGRRIGLVVDRIFGKCQTVIKPLGPLFENVPSVSGSTILGSGEVALIVDVAQLVQGVVSQNGRRGRKSLRDAGVARAA